MNDDCAPCVSPHDRTPPLVAPLGAPQAFLGKMHRNMGAERGRGLVTPESSSALDEANAAVRDLQAMEKAHRKAAKKARKQNLSEPEMDHAAVASKLQASAASAVSALALDPNNTDAMITLASVLPERTGCSQLDMLLRAERQAAQVLRQELGPRVFEEQRGRFWGLVQTRPYMRSLRAVMECGGFSDRLDVAVQAGVQLLRLCPGDNQGNRTQVAGFLARAGRVNDAIHFCLQYLFHREEDLCRPAEAGVDFPPRQYTWAEVQADVAANWHRLDDGEPEFAFLLAAGVVRQFGLGAAREEAERLLRAAHGRNKHVLERLLTKGVPDQYSQSGFVSPNSPETAQNFLCVSGEVLLQEPVGSFVVDLATPWVLRACSGPACARSETRVKEFKQCAACKEVVYCSLACQKAHWKSGHKGPCKEKRERDAQEAATMQMLQRMQMGGR